MNNSEISRRFAKFRKPAAKTARKLFISLPQNEQKYVYVWLALQK